VLFTSLISLGLLAGTHIQESDEFHIKNAFAFVSAIDLHAPRLTVEETFEFAYQCSTGGKMVREKVEETEIKQQLKQAEREHLETRLALSGLGLTEVKDTFVGDSNVRGVSGGQRRRVTVGEVRCKLLSYCVFEKILPLSFKFTI
jgi:ABC-type multidrug transport system ATPase subunit